MSDAWPDEVDWDAVEARFVLPPELRQPLPRRIAVRDRKDSSWRARAERGCLGGCLWPIFLLGVLLVFWAGLAALILPLGSTTTGFVTERERGNTRDTTAFLRFRFEAGAHRYQGEGQVTVEKWNGARVGDPVQVRYFPFAPGLRPLLADDFSPWRMVFGLGPLGLLMVAIGSVPLLRLITERQSKKLVRYGKATPAFIIERDDKNGQLTFLIRDENGRAYEVKERPKDTTTYYAGQVETALYLPNKPETARLYRCLDWKARPPS